jgi:4-amino-4-deoxy-L-arabinose transferase-like glycosyltransferase
VTACFFAVGVRLALVNESDGGWDSAANLVAARNVAEHRGFTTDMVQVHVVPQDLPGDESVRTPALPYLLGWLTRVFGASLALPVLLNVCIMVLAGIALRAAIAAIAPRWLADLMATLFILSGNNFDLVRVLNNDLLVLVTVLALLVATRAHTGRWRGWVVVAACAILIALGFLTKQSYVVSMVPF